MDEFIKKHIFFSRFAYHLDLWIAMMLLIIQYLAMGHRTASHLQVTHHRAKFTVHKVPFRQVHYQPLMFRIRENAKHIQRRK